MRRFAIPVLATVFLTTNAIAADVAPLPPGKPAGVKKAQDEDINPLIYVGVVAAGIGIALAVSNNDSGPTAIAPSTTSTSTTTTS